jgi:hypothetical protein
LGAFGEQLAQMMKPNDLVGNIIAGATHSLPLFSRLAPDRESSRRVSRCIALALSAVAASESTCSKMISGHYSMNPVDLDETKVCMQSLRRIPTCTTTASLRNFGVKAFAHTSIADI